ncbi:hypothetical protein J6590_038581 [Homalodisca vitripennis]|nr:hypothetical protein J6590_038581 [Homalodisca vitripennis]
MANILVEQNSGSLPPPWLQECSSRRPHLLNIKRSPANNKMFNDNVRRTIFVQCRRTLKLNKMLDLNIQKRLFRCALRCGDNVETIGQLYSTCRGKYFLGSYEAQLRAATTLFHMEPRHRRRANEKPGLAEPLTHLRTPGPAPGLTAALTSPGHVD